MVTSFYTEGELASIGFSRYGENVLVSRNAKIYSPSKICLGSNVRIDDFCILSGKIEVEDYVHIAAYSAIFAGDAGVTVRDFVGVSSRCAIYAESDDYSGEYLTNPTVNHDYLGIISGHVELGRHAIVGSGSTILPGVIIEEGVAVGSMSLVNKSLSSWGIYVGIPCKYIKPRSRNLLQLEKEFLEKQRV